MENREKLKVGNKKKIKRDYERLAEDTTGRVENTDENEQQRNASG